jgi:hypothetical protein
MMGKEGNSLRLEQHMIPVDIQYSGNITIVRKDNDSTKTQSDLDKLGLVLSGIIEAFAGEDVEVTISAYANQELGPIVPS